MSTPTEIHVSQILPGTAYQLIGTNSGATKDVYLTLSGTTSQVGVSTAGTTITFSTPQNIATTSSPIFQSLTLGSTTLGGITFNDTEGSPKTVILEAPTTITTSYILKLPVAQGATNSLLLDDGSGNLSWTLGYVSSITGTTNEVIASSATGAVTLSLPQAIATSSSPTFSAISITNLFLTGVTSDPGSPTAGQIWFRSDTSQFVGYNGTTNVIIG